MPSTRRHDHLIAHLPEAPGVYLLFGGGGELLYVGKSKTIRSRVRAHFASPEERRLCSRVRRVECRRTAGELGALLLESQLIKELRPLMNVRQRQKRRIIVARGSETPAGYTAVAVEAIDRIDPAAAGPVLGVFRNRRQAREYLAGIARTHRLCLKLLGLERTSRACFAYHLHQCPGACLGLEPPDAYNRRLEDAFAERRIQAWPFRGAVIIEERGGEKGERRDVFVVDNWCLLYTISWTDARHHLGVQGLHRFDYDSYRILAGYVFAGEYDATIRIASPAEIDRLMRDPIRNSPAEYVS